MPILLASLFFIVLHNVDGDEIMINVDQIVVLQHTGESKGKTNTLLTGGVKCAVGLANDKFIAVIEECGMIRQAIREAEKHQRARPSPWAAKE